MEAAIQKALDEQEAPLTAADAYESILPSVVHVRGLPYSPRPTPTWSRRATRCRAAPGW
jgi:hypothetical protein